MKILVISDNYPSEKFPNTGVFLYHLVQEFCKVGHEVTVISPFIFAPRKMKTSKTSYGDEAAIVYRPTILSTSAKKIGKFNTYTLTAKQQIVAIRSLIKKNKIEYDFVYCQFISNGLIATQALPKEKNIFIDVGEYFNIGKVQNWYSKSKYFSMLNKINGFIAVSPFVAEKLYDLNLNKDKIIVEQNGVNYNRFYPRDKKEMREKYGFNQEDFIVAFTGHFIHSKGPTRLLEAIENQKKSKLILIGNGQQEGKLVSEKIIFKDFIPNDSVPELLSAADVFSLPTLHEGSNNSILEAMACGLPVVSSKIPEVEIQCNDKNAILVDPMNAKEIEMGIDTIYQSKDLQKTMRAASLELAKKFSIKNRCSSILNFIQKEMVN